jgi:hypothetical protein
MDRAPFFSRAPLSELLVRTATVIFLSAAATAHATTGGLAITGPPQWRAIAGRPYAYTPQVTNSSGRALTFRIVNKPSWVTFNTGTGQLSGTPPNVVKYYAAIAISVTNGVTTARTPYFGIRVFPSNTIDKPTISGTPATSVTSGSPYAFQPSAGDGYGQPMSFSVKNKPAWASFSIATGRLYGIPTSAEDGTYGNVEISVTNGGLASALPAFSITVTNGVTSTKGSARLYWVAPTKNTNGTALTDLAGFRIYYGTSASNLAHLVQVANSAETSYTIGNLAAGTWYFATTAYATDGMQSARSSVVSKSIP